MSLNTDGRIGSKLPNFIRSEDAPGTRYDAGPYIGVVKDNRDPTRSGRLQVYIPDLGGDDTNPQNWRTVAYASPFLGTTIQEDENNKGSKDNSFATVRHSYGMWYNPPDLGNFVLCTFVAGDPGRGYWFACIPNQLGHHMVPALASSLDIDKEKIKDDAVKSNIEDGQAYPVVEFNEFREDVKWEEFVKEKKPIHEPQFKIILEQGTDRNKLTGSRGAIFSTSQRETPSGVFGVNTPGRPDGKYPEPNAKVQDRKVKTRLGGHSFVMDDGDRDGKNNLTRWRSAGGHQILMDDSEKIFYISNSNGSTWIEMTSEGYLSIWSTNSINVRTANDFNLHVDKDFNINVGGDFNLRCEQAINIESESSTMRSGKTTTLFGTDIKIGAENAIDLFAPGNSSFTSKAELRLTGEKKLYLNSGPGPEVEKPQDLPQKSSADTKKDGNGKWQVEEDKIKSVSKIVPTHEPWPRKTGVASAASNAPQDGSGDGESVGSGGNPPSTGSPSTRGVVTDSSGRPVTDSSGNPILSGTSATDPGPVAAQNSKVSRAAPESLMDKNNAPNPTKGVGSLTPEQTKGLMTQIAYNESGEKMDYSAKNQYGYLGRYQMGAAALVDAGYIHRSALEQYGGNEALNHPSSWTGKGGVKSSSDFLGSPGAQEEAMLTNTQTNYDRLTRNGGIKPGDDPSTVGGMLQTAHLLGAGGANKWRKTGSGNDAFGTTGTAYYNRGRYGVEVLGGRA